MNFFDTTENLTARVKTFQANFILFGFISFQNWKSLDSTYTWIQIKKVPYL